MFGRTFHPQSSRGLPILLLAGSLVAMCVSFISPAPSEAATRSALSDALEIYEDRLEPLEAALGDSLMAESDVSSALEDRDALAIDVDLDRAKLQADRDRLSGLIVHAYKDRGAQGKSEEAASDRAVAMSSSLLRSDVRALKQSEERLAKAQTRLTTLERTSANIKTRVDVLREEASVALSHLDDEVHALAPSLTGSAYRAAIRASQIVRDGDPECDVAPAVLVGISRIASDHGRADRSAVLPEGATTELQRALLSAPTVDSDEGRIDLDQEIDVRVGPFQLTPSQWVAHSDGDARSLDSPRSLLESARVAALALCDVHADLRTNEGLHRAVLKVAGDSSVTEAMIGAARHASRVRDLELGTIPDDPRIAQALARLELQRELDPDIGTSIESLIEWSRDRLGTPYSQCLGPEIRPEDPECPPGTNRFGDGFFDCSGFVSAAFAAIGVSIPTTTDAMWLDPSLQDSLVADAYRPENDRPGDILLMDGHVALSLGAGSIIHTSGGRLTEEPLPSWVRNGVFAIYRPIGGSSPTS